MIALLGSNFLSRAFVAELRRRRLPFIPLSRDALDFGRFDLLFDYLRHLKPSFVINLESYLQDDPCHALTQREALDRAFLLPQTVARACGLTNTPWAHLSSGSIYSGARVLGEDGFAVESDLSFPSVLDRFHHHPETFRGFAEHHPPNLTFGDKSCPMVSGASALGEETIRNSSLAYIWRLRLPFDESPEPWNFLHHLGQTTRIRDAINSIVHLGDAVRACLDLWSRQAPFGTYNIANPGPVTRRQVIGMMHRVLKRRDPARPFNEVDFSWTKPDASESNCILDTTKLQQAGIKLRSAEAAIRDALDRWPVSEPENIARVVFK
jgi:dTDP-4-dehydrorhamnose reductase